MPKKSTNLINNHNSKSIGNQTFTFHIPNVGNKLKKMNKRLHFIFFTIISLNSIFNSDAQITLSHNIGNVPIQTDMFSCETSQSWSRLFKLSDFNITYNEKFIIKSGQVALYNSIGGGTFQFNIYSADANFPETYSSADFIGSSQVINIPTIGEAPEVFDVVFDNPVIIPDGVENILIEVKLFYDINNPKQSLVYIAGTQEDNDVSYFSGCFVSFRPTETTKLDTPINNANFYINITGNKLGTDYLGSQTLLTHNECDDVVKVNQYGCSTGGLKFGRVFNLEDFGISNNEELVVDRGQVAIASVGVNGAHIQFRIYAIDNNFPFSYSQDDLIGSSQIVRIPYFGAGNGVDPRLFEVFFNSPITIPANLNRVLVEVFNLGGELLFIAGGSSSNDDSWLRSESGGCTPFQEYIAVSNPGNNFFVNVTGRTNHVTDDFEMNVSNICSEFLKEFSVENRNNIASVIWDFGDTNSGQDNTSIDLSPFHDFSEDGIYTITATITALDGSITILSETIDVIEPPQAYGIDNIIVCEDEFGSGISSSFDTSMVEAQVLGGQLNKIVTYIDGSGNEYDTLPNPLENTISDRETIGVRVAHQDTPCCYSETTFDLIVNPKPSINAIDNIVICDNDSDGIAVFDLTNVSIELINGQSNLSVELFDSNNSLISVADYNNFINLTANQDYIKAIATDTTTNCSSEITINLIVNDNPIISQLPTIYGCDDNNDGISEYFDISNVESQVLNGQTGMTVSYFDQFGNQLASPLPNPYTNSNAFNELLTVRVTDNISTCYVETVLQLQTVTQPNIGQPENLYACDQGNGYAEFDTSLIEQELIGNQTGLTIQYFDSDNNLLPNPLPILFQNTEPFSQTISIRVEDASNPICYSETSIDLIVNELPIINLEDEYFICNLEPSILLNVNSGYNSYNWFFEDGTLISSTNSGEITYEGNYTLTVTQIENGIICENSFDFTLIRSVLPEIQQVNFGELGNNYIEIIASGDGDFEYSIDGINYQDSNYFENIQGGMYTVFVSDKDGCGQDSEEVTLIDYPKFFTPNNDGYNDFWQIKGIANFPNSETLIFDRYGKLLARITSNNLGWNGIYNGKQMMSNDYWFRTDLGNGRTFTGHFSLKR